MSDSEGRMRAEVDRLLPSGGVFAANWSDVVGRATPSRSSPRRRWLTLLVAVLVAAICAGVAYGAAVFFTRGPNEILTVASGPDWSLVAHQGSGQLCLSYGAPGAAVDGCRLEMPNALGIWAIAPAGHRRARLIGLVAPNVSRIEAAVAARKPIRVRIYPLPVVFASPLRVIVIGLPNDALVRIPNPQMGKDGVILTAYDRHGHVLRRVSL
jgi:hypothetical protein